MKNRWRVFYHRLAVACSLGGCAALWSSAYRHAQAAFDSASDPVYADGWQAGDNGGSGFTPWNFDTDTIFTVVPGIHAIDSSSPFNNIGTSWRIAKPDDGLPRAGRGFAPLQIGQTLTVVVDPHTEHKFGGGWGVGLVSGGGNICYGGAACTPGTNPVERLTVWNYNFTEGVINPAEWGHVQVTSLTERPRFPTGTQDPALTSQDTPPNSSSGQTLVNGGLGTDLGLRIEFTLGPTPEEYTLKLKALRHPGTPYVETGFLANPDDPLDPDDLPGGPIDWITFLHYDVETDAALNTDFYVRSIEISGGTTTPSGDFDGDGDADGKDFLQWQRSFGLAGNPTLAQGNADGDADVDSADFAVWRDQFGGTGALVSASGVPEPMTWVSALAAAGCAARRVRRT